MTFLKLSLILAAVTLFVIACAQTNQTNPNIANNTAIVNTANQNVKPSVTVDELASARKIYVENCVKCHKEDGSGGMTDIEGVKIKAPNFKSDRMMKDKDEDWIEVIENGEKADGMPAYKGKISEEEIKNLVKFIRRDFQGKQEN